MDKKFRILVFPCGSEIGLEIHRSLRYSVHIELYGGNSINDHGKFVYKNYISNLPFFNEVNFINAINNIVNEYNIDAIYPAMDGVMSELGNNAKKINCKIIGSPPETIAICLSKSKTHKYLKDIIDVPKIYSSLENVNQYPVFMKPDIGYGSRGAKIINNYDEGKQHLKDYPSSKAFEFLSGKEYTIDCFTNKNGKLLFARGRQRRRIQNGISVNARPVNENDNFFKIAKKINNTLTLRGAWFFQVKEDDNYNLKLMEVASRLGGSSSLYRNLGVNFALLSVFDAFNLSVEIEVNQFDIEMDRALNNKFKLSIDYDTVYVDFDDCLLLHGKINIKLISFLFQAFNNNKSIILITRHAFNIDVALKKHRITEIFDQIFHLKNKELKSDYINCRKAIFIDDSFKERNEIKNKLNIPVFAPDAVEALILE